MARLLALMFLVGCGLARAAEMPIVFLHSAATSTYFKGTKTSYEDDLLVPWRSFFRRNHVTVREARANELASINGKAVLIIPSAVVLSDAERKAIGARVAAGWSVLGTWALGTRDEKGASRGYGFLEDLFGVKVAYDKPPEGDFRFFLPYGETPLTHRLRAGQRMYFRPSGEAPLRLRTDRAAGRLSDYNRDVSQPQFLMPVAAFDERGGSRRAYIGAAESSWDSAQAEMDALLLGTLDWLKRKPIVFKSAWPGAYEAALLLEMDTEDKFDNSLRFAAMLERQGLRGTFYAVTSEAARFPQVLKRLATRHEIAYHADVHDGFAKLAPARQDARLKGMIKQMKNLLPDVTSATGFRAPLEEYDATTEQLLRANGLRHHAASPDARDDVLPGFSTAEGGLPADKALVVLPRTWLDDMNLRKTSRLENNAAAEMVLTQLDDTLAMRGFGLLSIHTQQFYAGSPVERATQRLLQELPKHAPLLWTAPAESIVRWWRDREAAQVSTRTEPGRVHVTINAARAVQGLQLVLIPPGAGEPRLEAPALEARLEKLDAQRYAIVLPAVPSGKSELTVAF